MLLSDIKKNPKNPRGIKDAKFIYDSVGILRESDMDGIFYIKKDLLLHNKDVYLSEKEIDKDYLNL